MSAPSELSRPIKPRALPSTPLAFEASEAERAALASRFDITGIHRLEATVAFEAKDDAVLATGRFSAAVEQPCAVTRDPLTYDVADEFALRFVPEGKLGTYEEDAEFDLSEDDLDEIEYAGDSFDIGEAIAQELGLALDPYREGDGADEARREAGIQNDEEREVSGPLAEALRGLKNQSETKQSIEVELSSSKKT